MATAYRSTSPQGLDHRLPPMRLWHKAKRLGVWDPRDIDLTRDAADWRALDGEQRDVILRLTALFQGGEESVTLDLLPLMMVVAQEGRLEEEMYLTSFLWEEAKHVEAFRRFLDEVAVERTDLTRFHGPLYRRLFGEELPGAMNRLRSDASPVAQAAAAVTYNMIVEGVLAETGYHGYDQMLRRNGIMPGMQAIIGHLRRDEARHIAYGVFLLSRLIAEHGDEVWNAVEERLNELLPLAMGIVGEVFEPYAVPPFGLRMDEFADFAVGQFGKRAARLEKARGQTLAEVMGTPLETEEAGGDGSAAGEGILA
ncbi:MAG TPA: R2-like ligand-binding oxidase [Longimicrobium sp.]|nr:R2-like ligand-binding oxidase [Longimicrobium sp.]